MTTNAQAAAEAMEAPPYITPMPIPMGDVASEKLPDGIVFGSSPWWICQLLDEMTEREPRLLKLRAYYRGTQDTWKLHSEAARLAFGRAFSGLKANLAKPVVNAPAQRLRVEGFRIPHDTQVTETTNDTAAWRIWQANAMDSRAMIAHKEAIAMGECPVLVDRDPADPSTPRITVEDPLQVYVERDPANPRRRLAAVKRWTEPDGSTVLILYLPDRVEWWRAARTRERFSGYRGTSDTSFVLRNQRWELDPVRSGLPPVLGVIPVVPLVNAPQVDGCGEAEHESVLPLMDALNKELLDMLTTSEYAAFPLRYVMGVSLDDEEIPGQDDDTKPRTPFTAAINRILSLEDPDAKVGQLDAAPLEPYAKAIDKLVELIGTVSTTPYHLMLNAPTSVPASGEALKAAEKALDAKVEQQQVDFGEAWEEIMRIAFLTAGDTARASVRSETRWRAPSSASEASHMDALSKLGALGVDLETVLELVPLSPEQIARVMARLSSAAAAAAAAPAVDPAPPTTIRVLRDAAGSTVAM